MDTDTPVIDAACGVPVVSVPAPICRVIAEAVVAAVTTTVTVPNAAVEPEAGVFVTATLPTVAEHALAQVIVLVPVKAVPAERSAK